MKRRFVSILLMIAICICGVACVQNPIGKYEKMLKANKNPINLELWVYYNNVQKSAFEKLVDEFNSTVGSNINITIEPKYLSSVNELAKKVDDSAAKKVGAPAMPAMFMTYADNCLALDDKFDIVAPLQNYFTEEEKSAFIPDFISEGYYDGENLKIIPTAKSTEIFMMNKTDWDIFANDYNSKNSEKLNLSDINTIEGLISVSEKYYKWSNGAAFYGRDNTANYMLTGAMSLGDELIKTDESGNGVVTENKAVFKKLFDSYYIPYVKGYFNTANRFRSDDIKNQKILSMDCSSTGGSYFPSRVIIDTNQNYAIDSYVATTPTFAGKEKYAFQQGAGIAVTKSSELIEYASAFFLKWLNKKENSLQFAAASGYLPTTKDSLDEKLVLSYLDNSPITFKNSFTSAINTISNYKMYYVKPYKNSNVTRLILENCIQATASIPQYMKDFPTASAVKTAIEEQVSSGKSKDEAMSEYLSQSFYEEWYTELLALLRNACNGTVQ